MSCHFCCQVYWFYLFFFPCLHPSFRMKQFLRKWYDQHLHVMREGQRKNLSPQQDSNLCPPKHRAGALSTWAKENLWRVRQYTRLIFHISFTTHCDINISDPSSMLDACQIWTYYNCCRICCLNTDGVGRSLIFLGTRFHNFGPLHLIECFPCVIVLLNLGITNSLFFSGYLVSVLWKRSAKYFTTNITLNLVQKTHHIL